LAISHTPKTRPPRPLGHRVFGCTKSHDLGLHLRVSVPQQCLRGLLWPYEARHRLKLLHRRQASPTGDPRMLSAQTSAPRSGSGTSPERTCANARPSPSSSGFQAFLEKAAAIEHQQRRAAGLPTVSAPRHVRQSTCARGPGAHVGVSLDGEEGHASTSLDLAERQSVPVINLLPRPRRGVALGRR